jgi:hypothetical protein
MRAPLLMGIARGATRRILLEVWLRWRTRERVEQRPPMELSYIASSSRTSTFELQLCPPPRRSLAAAVGGARADACFDGGDEATTEDTRRWEGSPDATDGGGVGGGSGRW